ncbi:MAG: hypothetical protein JNM81_05815 [Rhodospirillaceae bacterium]|nr:hypothetical protein [Rhodospirillaceae bacterium]
MTAFFSRFVFPALLVSFATLAVAQPPSVQELRSALASAKRQANNSDTLDAAYELVGIAEEAQKAKTTEIIQDATTTLIKVIEKATQSAMNAGIPDAHDTLDQLVDLSFFTRTSNVLGADDVLQKSLRLLFPKITGDVRLALTTSNTTAERWPVAMTNLSILGELQAGAVLTMLDELSATIESGFNAEYARLEALAQSAANRESLMEDLKAARKNRDEQVKDAKANNLNTVVAEMSKSKGEQDRQESSDLATAGGDADMTCLETGILDQEGSMSAGQDVMSKLEEQCVLSGRIPSEDRCPSRNLYFLCRSAEPATERLIYTYRGTPEERSARDTCTGEVLPLSEAAAKTPAFKNPAMRRVMSCIPLGEADAE